MDKEHHNTVATPAPSVAKNPFFNGADRAPYKLGHLLLEMPPEFNSYAEQSVETYQRAEAVSQHAENAINTVLSGLHAIGTLMFVAANNPQNTVSTDALSDLGCFIEHIADELVFLRETQTECDTALMNRNDHNSKRGRK